MGKIKPSIAQDILISTSIALIVIALSYYFFGLSYAIALQGKGFLPWIFGLVFKTIWAPGLYVSYLLGFSSLGGWIALCVMFLFYSLLCFGCLKMKRRYLTKAKK